MAKKKVIKKKTVTIKTNKKDTAPVDTRLSYSSAGLLKNCSMKYFHHKVNNTKRDFDAEANYDAFNVGKCFHYVLEENGHSEDRLEELLAKGCKAFNVESSESMIHAMLLRYLQIHQRSELEVVKCELALENEEFLGFIDVILTDEAGYWWIADLKTAKFFKPEEAVRLPEDVQLNLYCSFYKDIAKVLGLDPKKWMGARYRVTTKSVLKLKANESYIEHVLRTAKNVKSYDIVVPKKLMQPKETYQEHLRLHQKSLQLRNHEILPERNRSHCMSFFKPCEFWSQCHGGHCFTESEGRVSITSTESIRGK